MCVHARKVLLNSIARGLAFRFGDVSIVLERHSEQSENSIKVTITVEKGGMRRDVSFEYEIGNLGSWRMKDK
jgi:hypothetical protein